MLYVLLPGQVYLHPHSPIPFCTISLFTPIHITRQTFYNYIAPSKHTLLVNPSLHTKRFVYYTKQQALRCSPEILAVFSLLYRPFVTSHEHNHAISYAAHWRTLAIIHEAGPHFDRPRGGLPTKGSPFSPRRNLGALFARNDAT